MATPSIRLGAPLLATADDPDQLAQAHRRAGYGAAVCPPLSLDDPQRIAAVRDAFARADVVIAEVGAWRNLMAPDEVERRANLTYVCERFALADEVGAFCCVDVAGSFSPTSPDGPHPDDLSASAFDLTVANVRMIIDSVKPRRARFALEMMPRLIPDGPDSYRRLIDAIDRPAFAVHVDIANVVNCPVRYFDTGGLIRECFAKLGPWIVSCHAKDVLMGTELPIRIDEVRPGLGVLDYGAYLTEIARLGPGKPLIMEHLKTAEEYAQAADFIRGVAASAGIDCQ